MRFTELTTQEEVQALIDWHNRLSDYLILDIETTGLDPFKDTITDIVISGLELDEAVIFSHLYAPCLNSLKIPVVAHNFRFDFNFLYRIGVNLVLEHDTMLLDHLLDENQEHGLDAIVKRRYNDNYKEVFWEKYKEYRLAPKDEQREYACKDIIYTGKIYRELLSDLKKVGIPDTLVRHVKQLAFALYQTEIAGIKLDLPYLEQMGGVLSGKINVIREEIRNKTELQCQMIENEYYIIELDKRKTDRGKAGVKRPIFNLDSTQQLGKLLYEQLRLPVQVNKAKNRTVDDAALERLQHHHSIIPIIREYRGYQKTFTAFIEGSFEKMRSGRIYPSFNVNGTVTGRISSSSPNMQQLPKEGGVRGIYVPDEGRRFISCDYSQLEVTLAAHFSRDKNLLSIVYEGASQHDITAKGLGIDRSTAKTINFALQYGAGVNKIQKILSCTLQEAEAALSKYWETYSGLAVFIKKCHESVAAGTHLINPFGRRRRFPDPKTLGHWELERCKRQAANSLIQGTGADLTSRAFYLVNEALRLGSLGKALFSVHDELLIEVKQDCVEESAQILQRIMIDVGEEIKLSVPLAVSCSNPMIRWED